MRGRVGVVRWVGVGMGGGCDVTNPDSRATSGNKTSVSFAAASRVFSISIFSMRQPPMVLLSQRYDCSLISLGEFRNGL